MSNEQHPIIAYVDEYVKTLSWSPGAAEHEKALVIGNLRGFASHLAAVDGEERTLRGDLQGEGATKWRVALRMFEKTHADLVALRQQVSAQPEGEPMTQSDSHYFIPTRLSGRCGFEGCELTPSDHPTEPRHGQPSETQERLGQIRERLAAHRAELAKYWNQEWAKGNALHYNDAPDDIDFLLSLIDSRAPVDSQGAGDESPHWFNQWPATNGFYWIRGWRHYGDLPINVDGEWFWMMFNLAKNHRTDLDDSEDVQFLGPITPHTAIAAATAMRTACVATLRQIAADYDNVAQPNNGAAISKQAVLYAARQVESLTLDAASGDLL